MGKPLFVSFIKEAGEKGLRVFIALLLFTPSSMASELEWVNEKTRPTEIRVGDQLRFKVENPEAVEIKPATGKSFLDEGWMVRAKKSSDTVYLTLIPLKSGKLTFPSLKLYNDEGQVVDEVRSVSFQVSSVLKKGEDPQDFEPPVGLGFPIWIAILAGVIFLLLFGGLLYWLQKRSQKKIDQPATVFSQETPEDQEAIEALDRLRQREFWKEGKFKEHYFGLSEIAKRYLGRRFDFDGLESTSSELLMALRSAKVSDRIQLETKELFLKLDQVKFTDQIPELAEPEILVELVRKLVLSTKRIPKFVKEPSVEVGAVK